MKHLKQPIASARQRGDAAPRASFYEQRYYSGALLSECGAAGGDGVRGPEPGARGHRVSGSRRPEDTSVAERLKENSAEALEAYLGAAGLGARRGRDRGGFRADAVRRCAGVRSGSGRRAASGAGCVRCRTRRSASATTSPWCAPVAEAVEFAGGAAPGPGGRSGWLRTAVRQAPAGVRTEGAAGRLDRPARPAAPRDAAARLTRPFFLPRLQVRSHATARSARRGRPMSTRGRRHARSTQPGSRRLPDAGLGEGAPATADGCLPCQLDATPRMQAVVIAPAPQSMGNLPALDTTLPTRSRRFPDTRRGISPTRCRTPRACVPNRSYRFVCSDRCADLPWPNGRPDSGHRAMCRAYSHVYCTENVKGGRNREASSPRGIGSPD